MNKPRGRLRIIGGKWRSRVVAFPELSELRPTPDRVRETLFNWLQREITGIRCLDLCAGSGILSWEALSRGAGHATLVDRDRRVVENLRQSAEQLGALKQVDLVRAESLDYLNTLTAEASRPGLVFLDPPFNSNLAGELIDTLAKWPWCKPGTLIYLESEPELNPAWPVNWQQLKDKQAGAVRYRLLRITEPPTST
ncbi:MAG: 16S rRNA (guanine(966)-N(2))-methyltransferase RsmD [Gammaproteobacteria bacterium]|nr:16S rRNA (guanine(966)-N(2))-methyltransferase RsmD [Gammaproteobacteria bacterium]